jgi:hypothetical protein
VSYVIAAPKVSGTIQYPKSATQISRRHIFRLSDGVFYWYSGGWSQLSPFGTAATNIPIVPGPGVYDDGEIGGMINRGNRSTRRKPALVPLCPPQTPHAARTQTRAAAVGSQRLTALATAWPKLGSSFLTLFSTRIPVAACQNFLLYFVQCACGPHVTIAWRTLRSRMEETASKYGA